MSKTFGAGAVCEAVEAGQGDFGENYVQEGVEKIAAVRALLARDAASGTGGMHLHLSWHYIGPIQSNKTRAIAERFDWVHTIDREKIAARLSAARDPGLPELQVCIQVNVSGESSKSGIAPEELPALAQAVEALPRLRLRGLMAIPEPSPDAALVRRRFAQLRELKEALNRGGLALDTLSMGMSADMETAIAEGATLVRIGTAVFGERRA